MTSNVTHFSETYSLAFPTLAPAAVLAYMTFVIPSRRSSTIHHLPRSHSNLPENIRRSEDWDADWQRCVNLAQSGAPPILAYVPGSIEDVWEGRFTVSHIIALGNSGFERFQYTDFVPYTSLLSGGPPPILRDCLVAQHRQTWKLREYHLLDLQENSKTIPLALGEAFSAFFPDGVRLREASGFLEVHAPGREDTLHYKRSVQFDVRDSVVADIIIVGEVILVFWVLVVMLIMLINLKGHSAWGQFNLYGRIRSLDGFISLIKEYVCLPFCLSLLLYYQRRRLAGIEGGGCIEGFLSEVTYRVGGGIPIVRLMFMDTRVAL